MKNIIPVILSGGSGTRLWPASREQSPKQFVSLFGGESLFQSTLRRCRALGLGKPVITAAHNHARYVEAQLGAEGAAAILLEPVARNSAPAIAAGALAALRLDPDALILVLPSDHLIQDVDAFAACVSQAANAARQGFHLTFGIVPEHPHTGYGYIELGAPQDGGVYSVKRFTEKPDLETARRYLAEKTWLWNSGMFLFPAKLLLEEIEAFEPGMREAVEAALAGGARSGGSIVLEKDSFAKAKRISIDYALMERTRRAAAVPAAIGWSDVGAWDAVWEVMPRDVSGTAAQGNALAIDAKNSLLWSDGPLIAALGIEDLAVIATGDAVLVLPRARAQDVRLITAELAKTPGRVSSGRASIEEAWGSREPIMAGGAAIGELLVLRPYAHAGFLVQSLKTLLLIEGSVQANGKTLAIRAPVAGPAEILIAGPAGAKILLI